MIYAESFTVEVEIHMQAGFDQAGANTPTPGAAENEIVHEQLYADLRSRAIIKFDFEGEKYFVFQRRYSVDASNNVFPHPFSASIQPIGSSCAIDIEALASSAADVIQTSTSSISVPDVSADALTAECQSLMGEKRFGYPELWKSVIGATSRYAKIDPAQINVQPHSARLETSAHPEGGLRMFLSFYYLFELRCPTLTAALCTYSSKLSHLDFKEAVDQESKRQQKAIERTDIVALPRSVLGEALLQAPPRSRNIIIDGYSLERSYLSLLGHGGGRAA